MLCWILKLSPNNSTFSIIAWCCVTKPGAGLDEQYVSVETLPPTGDEVPWISILAVPSLKPAQVSFVVDRFIGGNASIEIVKVVVVAHQPGSGVNVYVVVVVLSIDGDHVPVIPLLLVIGSAGIVEPEQ